MKSSKDWVLIILIEGGQTMNPSTEDMLNAIDQGKCRYHLSFLPNNKNIILAANQARDLTEDKNIIVDSYKDSSTGYYSYDQLCAGRDTGRKLEDA